MSNHGWGRIPIFKLIDYLIEGKIVIVAVEIDTENQEFVIKYEEQKT